MLAVKIIYDQIIKFLRNEEKFATSWYRRQRKASTTS